MSARTIIVVYVASNTTATARVVQTVHEMVDRHLGGEAEVTVIDVLAQPAEAEKGDVLITPTIDCRAPLPQRRVIGMPANADQLADALLLRHYAAPKDYT